MSDASVRAKDLDTYAPVTNAQRSQVMIDELNRQLQVVTTRVVALAQAHSMGLRDTTGSWLLRQSDHIFVTSFGRDGWGVYYQPRYTQPGDKIAPVLIGNAPLDVRVEFLEHSDSFVNTFLEHLSAWPKKLKNAIEHGAGAAARLDAWKEHGSGL